MEIGVGNGIDATSAFDVASADQYRGGVRRVASAPGADLGGREERVRTVECAQVDKNAAWRNLRRRFVVHEHKLRVNSGVFIELVAQERAGGIALVGPLEEIERAIVV